MLNLEEVNRKKRSGDFVTAGRMLNTTPDVVRMALKRPTHRHHKLALGAMSNIISTREKLINNCK